MSCLPPFVSRSTHSSAPASRPAPVRSVLDSYFADLSDSQLLSAAQEKELARRIADGDLKARNQLIRSNLRLVIHLARSYRGRGLDYADLIEEGNIGLLHAAENFDPDVDTRFSTYAKFWIRQSMHRALLNAVGPVRLPVYVFTLLSKWQQKTTELHVQLGREPSHEEVAGSLKLSRKKQAVVDRAFYIRKAASNPTAADELDEQCEALGNHSSHGHHNRLDELADCLANLDPRKAEVLRLRFGLDGGGPRSLQEVGEHLSLTRERVRQIEKVALQRLRHDFEEA